MHEAVIRGGTIVDGAGQAAFTGHVALKDGKIAQVSKTERGRRDTDANGLPDFFGFRNRGCLAVGKKAHVNDCQTLRLHIPEVRYDFRMNERQLVRRVDGYRNTFLSEASKFGSSVHTDVKPNCLVRASAL